MGELLKNKNILIMGVRNKWSIAWGIAEAAYEQGANLIFTYQGDREKESLLKLSDKMDNIKVYPCDVTKDEEIEALFEGIKKDSGILHGLVHAIAYAPTEDLQGPFINTSREGFMLSMNVSVYSFLAIAKYATPLMTEGGSLLTLTYRGAVKAVPSYNLMGVAKAALEAEVRYMAWELGDKGIRVNGISAGPIKTMSAKGVKNFTDILGVMEERTPLRRNINLADLGGSAVFLLSGLSSGTTGEILYVDAGYNIMGI